jgi:hypothetical protein
MYCNEASIFTDEIIIAIAIKSSSSNQNHLAIVFHDGEDAQLIHLVEHYRIQKDLLNSTYKWIDLTSIDDTNKLHLAAMCESTYLLNKDEGIPFAPCGGGKFNADGEYLGEIGTGLTCSLFVKEFFENQGYRFIDECNWVIRAEDISWQNDTLMEFDTLTADDHRHFEIQKELVGKALRFRPEEVAASATFKALLNNFADIEPVSLIINSEICKEQAL